MINYLLVATAKNLQNKNINKNEQTMKGMLQLFQLPLRAGPAAKIFKPGSIHSYSLMNMIRATFV